MPRHGSCVSTCLFSSFLEISRLQIVASVTVRFSGGSSHRHRQRPQTKPDRRSASLESRRQGVIGTPLTLFQRPAKSLRWWLWHGRARVAETYLKGLMYDCARLAEEPLAVRAAAARLQARCETLYTYLANNIQSLVDYGRRYRKGCPSHLLVPRISR